jgi:hypothetical protein
MNVDLKTTVASIAPTLGTMLDGPLAETAVAALAQAFGLPSTATQADITEMVQTGRLTPKIIAQVRTADQEYKQSLGQQGDSASKLQVAAQSSQWPGVLSAVTTCALLGIIAAQLYGAKLPNDSTSVQLIGSLTTGWGVTMAYWFGSTSSSRAKDVMLANSVPAQVAIK